MTDEKRSETIPIASDHTGRLEVSKDRHPIATGHPRAGSLLQDLTASNTR